MIKNKEDIKAKAITMQNNDILMIYSDGIVENKNPE
jgi:serine phosphatase RsbU (regulator of sigma subunit)